MPNKLVLRNMEFRAGVHLWSNPKLRGTPAEIPVILACPTLFDVVQLAGRYPLGELHDANRRLRACREISERQFLRTQEILDHIERAGVADPFASQDNNKVDYDKEFPELFGRSSPIPQQPWRALAEWLPGGLPTIVGTKSTRHILLRDVPLEIEIALRRWIRWQLALNSNEAAQWLIETAEGLALTQTGWRAFLKWLTDALLQRLDQMEIGM